MAHKPTHPVLRAALGLTALAAIVVLANWLISLTPLGSRGVDFTQNKNHSLSQGTRDLVRELDTPVVIRYYASRNSAYMPEQLKLHMRRVDDLLKEYAALAPEKLRIENLDPQPDTDAEDRANLDGVTGQRINDENLYFGLAVACLDRTSVLPGLDPADETMLEYHISKAISEVTTPSKPVVGIMSALELKGGPAMMPGQRPTPPWVFYSQLKQSYKVKDLGMNPTSIDPKEIKVLLLFHPAGITPEAEFAIDQYVLGGGTVVACVDAFSIAAQMTGGGNPMMGMSGGTPTASTLPTLFPAWGVNFESGMSLADPAYKTKMRTREDDGTDAIAVLTLPQGAMPQKDNVITKDLESIMMLLPGGFTKTSSGGVDIDTLVRSSTGAGLVDSSKASRLDPSLSLSLKPTGTAYDLVTHLHGTFKTAFPDGKPGDKPADKPADANKDTAKKDDAKKEDPAKPSSLKTGTAPGNVFLIADIDAFFDQFAYRVQNFGGMQMASPANGNPGLLFNIIDQATGSKYLIGARSRAAVRRPFTVIQEMETQFEKEVGDKITKFQQEVDTTNQKLAELQSKRSGGTELHLSPEQEAEIKKLRETGVENRRKIRDMQKDLRRKKDTLTGNITLANIFGVPILVIVFGLGLFLRRRAATRAR